MSLRKLIVAFAVAGLCSVTAQAGDLDVLKIGLPGDSTDVLPVANATRLVTFRYNPDVSFAVRALKDTFVNVEVPEGEVIHGFYLSDPARWTFHVTEDARRVLVKPLEANLINTGTLVTDKRSYELTMISVDLGDPWYQRVRWQIPGSNAQADGLYWRGTASAPSVSAGGVGGEAAPPHPDDMNFRYSIKGRAKFKPEMVFDDGVRTWFKFGQVQDLPAIFGVVNGKLEVIEFSVQGPYVVVPSINDEFKLRLRNEVIVVERRR